MKIYTKTGDDGTTGLFGGARTKKTDPRVAAYGTTDELNSFIGVARATKLSTAIDSVLARVQEDLFVLGSELACAEGKEDKLRMELVSDADAKRLEDAIDAATAATTPLKYFVLPGGSPQAAALHVARTVCRRAEREVLGLTPPVRGEIVIYLNRLSDLLFSFARQANAEAGVEDVPWKPRG